MNSDLIPHTYNPDVLSCLANLSNDEVFTPPDIVNNILDMLPDDLWHDKNAKFLDIIMQNLIQFNDYRWALSLAG